MYPVYYPTRTVRAERQDYHHVAKVTEPKLLSILFVFLKLILVL
jgi:hypothetical protein